MKVAEVSSTTRREFMKTGAALGAVASAGLSSLALGKAVQASPAWVPPQDLLDDLPHLMRVASLPGLAMASVSDGRVVWQRTFGVRNARTGEPVETDTLFEAASISKPVFAYVVIKLAEEGVIDLDRPLASYLKPENLSKDPRVDRITARQVLRHATGLPNWQDTPETLPAFEPGTAFGYSGEGFFWIQQILEQKLGLGLDVIMRSHLFEPAGMQSSTYAWSRDHAKRLVDGHEQGRHVDHWRRGVGDKLLTVAERWNRPIHTWTADDTLRAAKAASLTDPSANRFLFLCSASSLLTTVGEYARFMALVMSSPASARWAISERSRAQMLSPQIETTKGSRYWWGSGWALEKSESGWLFSHSGSNDNTFKTLAVGEVHGGRALVIFTNGDSGNCVYERIVRATTGIDPLGFIANLNPPRTKAAA